jgi:alkanesulfonate monooxygenase SsuD/methylene tetrahydromethanopterin reductase-like flavin-dependent oxidoreductase (luciferase family)
LRSRSGGAASTSPSRCCAPCSPGTPDGFEGDFYATRGIILEPPPAQQPGPPIRVANWGSPPASAGRPLRHGWLASAYNTTPEAFPTGLARLADAPRRQGRDPASFPNGIATAWSNVTEDRSSAERMLTDILAPMLNRTVDELRSLPLPIGSPELCAERLTAFARAGAQRLFFWPLRDEVGQLERFRERVAPLVAE